MISRIQIQTVDTCNARCIMCPHKSLPHNHQVIDDQVFIKIIQEIKKGIDNGWVVQNPQVLLFLHNEPLCDPQILDKVEYIKNILSDCYIQIFTNGLNLKKYTNPIIHSRLDYVYLSMYGYDHNSYNKIAGTSITPEKFQDIHESIEKIRKYKRVKIANCWQTENGTPILFEYSSRAGFYTEKIYVDKILGCAHNRVEGWLNFFADGKIPLCCMDWRKEAILGDITKNTLEEILLSEQYQILKDKANGKIGSESDFICKRCEWTLTAKENPVRGKSKSKRLIVTSASENKMDYLLDFVISLRTLGQYKDEILLLDYGLPDYFRQLMKSFDVTISQVTQPSEQRMIVNTRLFDLYTTLKQFYPKTREIVLFDVDIWFQDAISTLFEEINDTPGCIFATEFRPGFFKFGHSRGPDDPVSKKQNLAKMTEVVSAFHGHLNAGMMAGKRKSFMEKLEQIIQKTREGYLLSTYGIDQYLYNLLFDFKNDKATGKKYNCVLNDIISNDGVHHLKRYKEVKVDHKTGNYQFTEFKGEKAVAIHCYLVFNEENQQRYRFRYTHQALFNEVMMEKIYGATNNTIEKFIRFQHEKEKRGVEATYSA